MSQTEMSPLAIAIDKFAMNLQKSIFGSSNGGNTVVSPLSIQTLLALYSTTTEGDLRRELVDHAFVGKDREEVLETFGTFNKEVAEKYKEIFVMANKVYVTNRKGKLSKEFSETAEEFRAEVEPIDFDLKEESANKMNRWVAEKTQGKITNLIDELEDDLCAILVNAIYLKAEWDKPFNKRCTKKADFHVTKNRIAQVDMMGVFEVYFKYYESKEFNFKAVSLPYKGRVLRMVIVVPDDVEGLAPLLDQLAQGGLRSTLEGLNAARNTYINLRMPKFKIETTIDFNEEFPKIGISKIFELPSYKLIEGLPVKVSKALQKAYVDVDEQGTEAAAASGMGFMFCCSKPPPLAFTVDRPFFYAILKEDIICFAGTFTEG